MLRPLFMPGDMRDAHPEDNPSRPPFEKGGEDTPPNREFLSGAYPPEPQIAAVLNIGMKNIFKK